MAAQRTRGRGPEPGRRDYVRLQRECRQWKEKARAVSHQLLSAREEERKKISRELHDVLAQALADISARLAAMKADLSAYGGDLAEKISGVQQLVEKSMGEIHRFARDLRPTALDDLGLVRALQGELMRLRRKTGLPVTLTAAAAAEKIGVAEQTMLYRVAQEALANVARHAQATRVEVKLQKFRRHVALSIRDDGRGLAPGRQVSARRGGRLGLIGMQERVEMMGGSLRIKSTPGKGTLILIKVPLQASGTRPR